MAETAPSDADSKKVQRSLLELHGRAQYALLAATIIALALTGLPQKFDSLGFSQWLMDAVGGIETLRVIHRVAGGAMIFAAVYHLALALVAVLVFRTVGPLPMTPDLKDIRDVLQMVRYFLGLRQDRVAFERPSYFEKIDYLVIAWSVVVMGVSGFVFLFPVRVSSLVSGDAVLAALEVHSDSAVLVLAWVVLVHLVYVRLAPALFPSRATALGVETQHLRPVAARVPETALGATDGATGADAGNRPSDRARHLEAELHARHGPRTPGKPELGE